MKNPAFAILKLWEKTGMQWEMSFHTAWNGAELHLRYSCTLRWHHGHWPGCVVYGGQISLQTAAASSQAARGPPSVLSESGRLQTVTMLSGILSEFLSDILSLAFDLAYTNIYWHFRLKLLTNNLQWSHSRDHVPLFFFPVCDAQIVSALRQCDLAAQMWKHNK